MSWWLGWCHDGLVGVMMGWWVGGYYHLFMKKVIIMGATSGLGLGVAVKYLQEGWMVGACGRNSDRLSELSARWPGRLWFARLILLAKTRPMSY